MNFLLDYASSSDTSEHEDALEVATKTNTENKTKLPKPVLEANQSTLNTSVFTNPFAQAEMEKAAILEKHVKMVSGADKLAVINGKKVCWSFRKGKCRFGHNCKYAHDTDIQKTPEEIAEEKAEQQQKNYASEKANSITSAPSYGMEDNEKGPTSDEVWEGTAEKRRLKRPGLSKTLVPGKKVLKMYKEQKLRDSNKKSCNYFVFHLSLTNNKHTLRSIMNNLELSVV